MTSINPTDQVRSLPGLGDVETIQFAGYSPISTTNNSISEKLFYWFVGAKDYENKPTIIWTNGGPGSSSFWGFFLENGPYRIVSAIGDHPIVRPNPTGWNNYVNYMIFEHPLSVTLSFATDDRSIPKTPEEGIEQLYKALIHFMEMHPEIACNPIILAGESYGGTYLPLLAEAILDGNKTSKTPLHLKSIVLCDAWVDPFVQMAQNTTYAHTHGLISQSQKDKLDREYIGEKLAKINNAIFEICGCYMANTAETKDPSFDPVLQYLNRDDVRKALHIDERQPITKTWSPGVSENYQPYVNKSYRGVVQNLLNEGIKVQVISGLNDAKDCNFLGTEAWINLLNGPAHTAFECTEPTQWKNHLNETIGFEQDGGTLSWLKVLNAGHLAVMDQPLLIEKVLEKALGK